MMSMGFIDQIMGAMGMEAAQTVTEEPTSNADPQRTEETKIGRASCRERV